MRQNDRLSLSSAPVSSTPEYYRQPPQVSSSFSALVTSLKNPSSGNISDSEGANGNGFTTVDQYSSSIRRKHVKESPGSGIGDKISHGIGSLGKPFNLSLGSRDKKKDSEKSGDKLTPPKSGGKISGIFGQKNVDPEKTKNGGTENEKVLEEKVPNEKEQSNEEYNKSEITTDSEKTLSEKQEKELPKKKDETTFPSPTSLVEGFTWSRKKEKEKEKEKDSPHIKYRMC
jgi:hypothetical protein